MALVILAEFLEDAPQAVRLAREARAGGASVRLIALSPAAMEALERHGEDAYHLPASIDQHQQLNAVAAENLERFQGLVDIVQRHVTTCSPAMAGSGCSVLRCHVPEALILMDIVAFLAVELEHVVRTHAAGQVAYFGNARLRRRAVLFGPSESVWANLCRVLRTAPDETRPAWARAVRWTELESGATAWKVNLRIARQEPGRFVRSMVKAVPGALAAYHRLTDVLRVRHRRREHDARSTRETTRVLLLGWLTPDLTALTQGLRGQEQVSVWHWRSPSAVAHRASQAGRPLDASLPAKGGGELLPFGRLRIPRRRIPSNVEGLGMSPAGRGGSRSPGHARWAPQDGAAVETEGQRLWEALERDPEARRLLTWNGVCGLSVAREHWRHLFCMQLPRTVALYQRAQQALAALRPHLLVHGELGELGWERTVVEAARPSGVPSLFYQWGGNYGYLRQPYLDLTQLHSDYMLTYTPRVAEVLSEQVRASRWARASLQAAGSPYLAGLRQRFRRQPRSASPRNRWPGRSGRFRVVYVASSLSGSAQYGPFHWVDDGLYYQLQRRILTVLAEVFPHEVALKLPLNRVEAVDPVGAWMARRRLPMHTLRRPLNQCLGRAQAWVIDGTATALQEVLLTGKPVLYVHARGVEFHPEAFDELRQQAQVVDGWEPDFEARLRTALERLWDDPPAPEAPFTRHFVTPDDDPDAVVRRAVGAVLELAARGAVRDACAV